MCFRQIPLYCSPGENCSPGADSLPLHISHPARNPTWYPPKDLTLPVPVCDLCGALLGLACCAQKLQTAQREGSGLGRAACHGPTGSGPAVRASSSISVPPQCQFSGRLFNFSLFKSKMRMGTLTLLNCPDSWR